MKLRNRFAKYSIAIGIAGLCGLGTPGRSSAGDLDQAINMVLRMNEAAAQSQDKIDKIDDDTADLQNRYRAVQQRIESMKLYNVQVGELVGAQRKQLGELGTKIDSATNVGREITPLLLRMLDVLDQFVQLDIPFLIEERTDRVKKLREMMQAPDVTEAEKYRRILEAYQIENDYGKTIEAYTGEFKFGEGDARTVNFLRVGRISLVYQTLDGEKAGAWDPQQKKWVDLSSDYLGDLTRGIRIAKKQAPPALISLPVLAAQQGGAK
jgi:hypothetical protein